MSTTAPLPVKDGVGPTRLRIPDDGPWRTVEEFIVERFGHIARPEIRRRFDAGEIVGVDGSPVRPGDMLGAHEFVWYYRELADEQPLPYRETILHQDDDLIVVDKPHFLPTTPGGRYLRESTLVRLRVRLNNPEITPIHRLDRPTAGLVLFSARTTSRGPYQSLFERRRVTKTYEAVSALPQVGTTGTARPGVLGSPLTITNHIRRVRDDAGRGLRVCIDPESSPNSETLVELVASGVSASGRPVVHTRLSPRTGRMHQLRVHLASIGLPILGDRWYPELLPEAPDDPALPLQLLARELTFVDPLSQRPRSFVSGLQLSQTPVLPFTHGNTGVDADC